MVLGTAAPSFQTWVSVPTLLKAWHCHALLLWQQSPGKAQAMPWGSAPILRPLHSALPMAQITQHRPQHENSRLFHLTRTCFQGLAMWLLRDFCLCACFSFKRLKLAFHLALRSEAKSIGSRTKLPGAHSGFNLSLRTGPVGRGAVHPPALAGQQQNRAPCSAGMLAGPGACFSANFPAVTSDQAPCLGKSVATRSPALLQKIFLHLRATIILNAGCERGWMQCSWPLGLWDRRCPGSAAWLRNRVPCCPVPHRR